MFPGTLLYQYLKVNKKIEKHYPYGQIKKTFNAVQQWLLRHNCKDPKDFVDGACEPLALYLSTSILSSIVDGSFLDVMHSNEIARITLKEMKSEEAAKKQFSKNL